MKRLKIELPGKGKQKENMGARVDEEKVQGWSGTWWTLNMGGWLTLPGHNGSGGKGRRKDSTNNCSGQTSSQTRKESTKKEASTRKQQWCRTVKVQQERQSTERKVERRKLKTHSATSGRSTRKTLNKLIKKTERTNGIRLTCS